MKMKTLQTVEKEIFCDLASIIAAKWALRASKIRNTDRYELTCGEFYNAYGLPKWSNIKRLDAFIDSEGGPERFAEILERGIL